MDLYLSMSVYRGGSKLIFGLHFQGLNRLMHNVPNGQTHFKNLVGFAAFGTLCIKS